MNAGLQRYVAGFLFQQVNWHCENQVALVLKAKPAWQAGHWNGIGGKIEDGEASANAMRREFYEETGSHAGGWWRHYATLYGPRASVDFYANSVWSYAAPFLPETNDVGEPLQWWPVSRLPKVIGNLRWLVPMALDRNIIEPVVRIAWKAP